MAQPAIEARYYYWRDEEKRPLITLCRLVLDLAGELFTAYGWAITSPRDTPHKDDMWFTDPDTKKDWCEPGGRTIAKARALRALKLGKPCYHHTVGNMPRVLRYARAVVRLEARHIIADCQAYAFRSLVDDDVVMHLPPSMQPPCLQGAKHATE